LRFMAWVEVALACTLTPPLPAHGAAEGYLAHVFAL